MALPITSSTNTAIALVELFEVDHLRFSRRVEQVVRVVDVGDAARHARGEVATGRPEDDDAPAGHVLTAVVADAFDDAVAPELRTQNRSPTCPRR